jgi:hypothetical protein
MLTPASLNQDQAEPRSRQAGARAGGRGHSTTGRPAARPSAKGGCAPSRVLARLVDGGAPDQATALDGGAPDGGPQSGVSDGGSLPGGLGSTQTSTQGSGAATSSGATPVNTPPPQPPDRDTIVRQAIEQVLGGYRNMTATIPTTVPPAPGRRATAAGGAAGAGGTQAGAAAAPPTPAQVTFASPYFIESTPHGLAGAGVAAWFQAQPLEVRVGKGTPQQLQAAVQDAIGRGLLNSSWPPTAQTIRAFMTQVGLGVDCSGFVYRALQAADPALTGAGLPGVVGALPADPRTGVLVTGSQALGPPGHTRITAPAALRVGDIVQMAPNASHKVGHVRIITAVRVQPGWVEYDTAESTTRVGSGPQASTWRMPAAGPMDSAHLQVQNAAGGWDPESSGRASSYWRRLALPAAAPAHAAPAQAAPLARSPSAARDPVGAREPTRTLAREATSPPRAGGWNADDHQVAGTWRIAIDGLTAGVRTDDPSKVTKESAAHEAIAIVPTSVKPENLEVLVHFHGLNVGQRERSAPSESGMTTGTVRDVEADLIPQQLAGSARNMIAILPQGTVAGGGLRERFGITDLDAYVKEVLGQVVVHVNKLDASKKLTALTPVRTVVSGHSGGGPAAVQAASKLQVSAGATDDQWAKAPPLLLFDAINGIEELKTLTSLVLGWLETDKRFLLEHSEAEARALLARRGLKLRSTYTSGVYWACNTKQAPRTYQYAPHPAVTVPAELSLEAQLDSWFAKNSGAFGALASELRKQYVVEHMVGTHDFTVGAGSLQTGTRTPVGGVTQAPGAPASSTQAPVEAHGSLAKALGLLSTSEQLTQTQPGGVREDEEGSGGTLARQVAPAPSAVPASAPSATPAPSAVPAPSATPAPSAAPAPAPAPAPSAAPATRQPPGASGTHQGQRYVVYQDEVRVGGTKAWRNNNPGNIIGGAWANAHGAIGTAFDMAVFPDEATGAAAIPALLRTARYQAMTIREAISTYAPPRENNTEAYIQHVTTGAHVPETTRLSALADAQLDLIVDVIRGVEGWAAGTTFDRTGPDWVRALLGAAPAPAPAAPAPAPAAPAPAPAAPAPAPAPAPAAPTPQLARLAAGAGVLADARVHPDVQRSIASTRGAGTPLPSDTAERLGALVGDSLSDVRVHADGQAAELARSVSARAFTVGSDMYFAAGEYDPRGRAGQELLAHEAAHVTQQRGAPVDGPLSVSQPGDAQESEAENAARRLRDAR